MTFELPKIPASRGASSAIQSLPARDRLEATLCVHMDRFVPALQALTGLLLAKETASAVFEPLEEPFFWVEAEDCVQYAVGVSFKLQDGIYLECGLSTWAKEQPQGLELQTKLAISTQHREGYAGEYQGPWVRGESRTAVACFTHSDTFWSQEIGDFFERLDVATMFSNTGVFQRQGRIANTPCTGPLSARPEHVEAWMNYYGKLAD